MGRWIILSAAIVLAEAIAAGFLIWLGQARHGEDWRYFKEGGPGTILSVLNLVACSAVCWLVRGRFRNDTFGWFWVGACILFAVTALDDFFRLHESVAHAASRTFGYYRRHPVLRHLDDVLIVLYALAALSLGLYHVRPLLRLRPMIAMFGVAGVFFAGMVTLDLLRWSYAYEDSLKILAGATIWCGLMYPLFTPSNDLPYQGLSARARDSSPQARAGSP